MLRTLGYDARLHLKPGAQFTLAFRRGIQISADGDWLADYPAPSAYVPQFFGCHGGLSNGYVCDRQLERLMARGAWRRADRRITDQALWVPTETLAPPELVSSGLRNYQFHPVWGFIAGLAALTSRSLSSRFPSSPAAGHARAAHP